MINVMEVRFGHSNPTYFVKTADGKEYVLRKRPPGNLVSQTAHRVDREYKVLNALSTNTDLPVPRVVALCTDRSMLITEFYLMDCIDGRHFEEPHIPGVDAQTRKLM